MTPPTPRNALKLELPPPRAQVPVLQSFVDRAAYRLTRPICAYPIIGLSVLLLGWSLLVRLPKVSIPVGARGVQSLTNSFVSAEIVAELEKSAQAAAQQLIRDPEEVPRLVARLEQFAHTLGFNAQVSMSPVITNAAGFRDLALHPAVIRLETRENRERGSLARMLQWLRHASTLGRKVETRTLSLRANAEGLASAQVELHFWTINPDAGSAPEGKYDITASPAILKELQTWAQALPAGGSLRDPFAWPAYRDPATHLPGSGSAPVFLLQAISIDGDRAFAVLNHRVLGVGERIGDHIVERILPTEVWLRGPAGQITLRLAR